MDGPAAPRSRVSTRALLAGTIAFLLVFVIAVSMVAGSSNPDPTDVKPGEQSLTTSIVNASVIVFREGLEAVLIFAAITASFIGRRERFRRPVTLGVVSAFAATIVTWFVMTSVVRSLPFSNDVLLAITGITAVVVLLLVMNWFFHKVYWTDHIRGLNTKKRDLVEASESSGEMRYWGLVALGFTAVYREGFEVVLFLQNLNLVAGSAAVAWGVALGLAGTAVVGFLTFHLHHRLPYKRMLVLTGVLLGMVLVVMAGGSARTLQALGVVPTTPLGVSFPDWWARWFELVPTVETVLIQVLAAVFVVGSYYAAEWWAKEKRRRRAPEPTELRVEATQARTTVTAADADPAPEPAAQRAPARVPAAPLIVLPQLALEAPRVAAAPAAMRVSARPVAPRPAPVFVPAPPAPRPATAVTPPAARIAGREAPLGGTRIRFGTPASR